MSIVPIQAVEPRRAFLGPTNFGDVPLTHASAIDVIRISLVKAETIATGACTFGYSIGYRGTVYFELEIEAQY